MTKNSDFIVFNGLISGVLSFSEGRKIILKKDSAKIERKNFTLVLKEE